MPKRVRTKLRNLFPNSSLRLKPIGAKFQHLTNALRSLFHPAQGPHGIAGSLVNSGGLIRNVIYVLAAPLAAFPVRRSTLPGV